MLYIALLKGKVIYSIFDSKRLCTPLRSLLVSKRLCSFYKHILVPKSINKTYIAFLEQKGYVKRDQTYIAFLDQKGYVALTITFWCQTRFVRAPSTFLRVVFVLVNIIELDCRFQI